MIGALVGFLLLAIAFAITVSRTLQAEVQSLLVAARAIGRGDFSKRVPTEGNDEFAALGKEFNSMAEELEERLEELQRERARLAEAIRRVGESFTKSLDRVGLLEIVVQTAVDGVEAACGRATIRRAGEERLRQVASTGDPDAYERVLHAAEAAALDAGQIAEIELGGASALAAPAGRRRRRGHRLRRPRRPPLHAGRARAVLLPDQPGVGVGRERRPARDRAAPGGDGRADRACSTTAASRRS